MSWIERSRSIESLEPPSISSHGGPNHQPIKCAQAWIDRVPCWWPASIDSRFSVPKAREIRAPRSLTRPRPNARGDRGRSIRGHNNLGKGCGGLEWPIYPPRHRCSVLAMILSVFWVRFQPLIDRFGPPNAPWSWRGSVQSPRALFEAEVKESHPCPRRDFHAPANPHPVSRPLALIVGPWGVSILAYVHGTGRGFEAAA